MSVVSRVPEGTRPFLLPLAALALALAFLAADSVHRIRGVEAASALREGYAPMVRPDPASPSGFEAGQHRLVLPGVGADGYHWILQTEAMLAGEGLRIRRTTVDNAPDGRDVHWSSLPRWWLASVAQARRALRPDLTPPQAVEQVAAGAGAIALVLFLLGVTPLLALKMGPVPASLFAVAWVGVFPLYEMFMVGIVDHHGFLAMFVFGSVASLLIGGGGWVRVGEVGGRSGLPFPEEGSARRWFAAAGVAGGLGLWVSAVSMAPVLLGTAAGALVASGVARRSSGAVRPAPELWRLWGAAGCATSLACYALEYAPAHLGMRLEVNHPLYALAWAGAGELLTRAWRGSAGPTRGVALDLRGPQREWPWIAAALLLVSAPPAWVLATGGETFRLADPFLRAVHTDFIREFQGLARHLAGASGVQALQSVSALPLVLLPAAALLCVPRGKGAAARALQAWGGGTALVGLGFVFVVAQASAATLLEATGLLSSRTALARVAALGAGSGTAALAFTLLFPAWRRDAPSPHPEVSGRIATVGGAAAAPLVLVFWQVRWLPTAAAALLALLLALAAIGPPPGAARRRQRAVWGGFLLLIFVPFPLMAALLGWRWGHPTGLEGAQVVTRDAAYRLRARTGEREVIIAAPPVTTTWLIYFGGFRGLGTLYWENLAGLHAIAALAAAPGEREVREILAHHGVTYLVVPSWEPFPALRCDRGAERVCVVWGVGARGGQEPAFLQRTLASDSLPEWLVAVPYEAPPGPALEGAGVRIFEVRLGGRGDRA